jgi:hypothetical protein
VYFAPATFAAFAMQAIVTSLGGSGGRQASLLALAGVVLLTVAAVLLRAWAPAAWGRRIQAMAVLWGWKFKVPAVLVVLGSLLVALNVVQHPVLLKLLSSTNSVPVFIDEYKPFDMPKHRRHTLHRYMRRLYTGEVESRGRADQTVVSYRLHAPLCLAGETRPIESALVERIITANPSKDTLPGNPQFVRAFQKLKTVVSCSGREKSFRARHSASP